MSLSLPAVTSSARPSKAVRAGGAQCCAANSEFLSPRSQIQLKRPSASLLKVEIIVSFRYGLRRQKRVTPSFQEQLSVPLRLDLPIDDHMSNVNPFWAPDAHDDSDVVGHLTAPSFKGCSSR